MDAQVEKINAQAENRMLKTKNGGLSWNWRRKLKMEAEAEIGRSSWNWTLKLKIDAQAKKLAKYRK